MPTRRRRLVATLVGAAFAVSVALPAIAANPPARPSVPLPASVSGLKLKSSIHQTGATDFKMDRVLRVATGPQRVAVRLSEEAAVDVAAGGASAQRAQIKKARAQQDTFIAAARRLDGHARLLGRTSKATNIVMMRIDAASLRKLAADPGVVSILPIRDYELALGETVPYVGATAVQAAGFTGKGVRVAVLDTGIDYTHVEFGGAGTAAAYTAAYGTSPADARNKTTDGLFPTAKVVGGYDFVGEAWTGNAGSPAEAPDPDPIDAPSPAAGIGTDGGHGTHVADIIAGKKGVAPGASLYAVKVCSSLTTHCSGVAMLQGFDFAVDPNGDGDTRDHVNTVSISIGSDYGLAFDDDLSYAIDQASRLGVLSVAASGNGSNKPYVTGIPAAAASAISVAQTEVPSAVQYPLVVDSPAKIAGTYTNTTTVTWADLGSGFSGNVVYLGQGCPANSKDNDPAEDPYLGNPAGADVVLIDRGACSVSLKVDRAAKAGAKAVLVGLVAAGDAYSFGYGGGDTFVPTLVIQDSLRQAIIANIAAPVHVTVSSAVTVALVGGVVGSSSRGPSLENRIKPEIGAPGASVSAVAGSGTGTEAFGGTSGATPMVSGAAALLQDAFPGRSPLEIKAVLMNTAETEIYTNKATEPGVLAPVTRVGGGELRVDRALKSPAAAWVRADKTGALGFGFVSASRNVTWLSKTLTIRNYSKSRLTYKISPTFRYANDKANGAVKVYAPSSVTLRPRETRTITVSLRIDGSKLRPWTLDSGIGGNDPTALDLLEYDGYLNFDNVKTRADNADPLHVAWQVLPRKSDDVEAKDNPVKIDTVVADGPLAGAPAGTTKLRNDGVGPAYIDAYSLVGTSPNLPPSVRGANAPVIDLKAFGVQTFPVPAGYCSANESFVYVMAVNTWERTTTALAPAEFDVVFDTNRDGTPDYIVFTADASGYGSLSDGRSLTWSFNLKTGAMDAFFFTDHGTNSANTILTICGEQIGLDATAFGKPMSVEVDAVDWYFSGQVTDVIGGLVLAPLGERYFGVIGADGFGGGDIAPHSSAKLTVADFGNQGTTEKGLLLVLDASRGDVRGGAPKGEDSLLVRVKP